MNANTIVNKPSNREEETGFVRFTGKDEHTTHYWISHKGLFLLWWAFMGWAVTGYVLLELGVDRGLRELVSPVATFSVCVVMVMPRLMGGHVWRHPNWVNHLHICLGLLTAAGLVVVAGIFVLRPIARLLTG